MYRSRQPHAPLAAAPLVTAALIIGLGIGLTGCGGSGGPRQDSAHGSSGPTQVDLSAWAAGRSTPVADPIYPYYGTASLDVFHYGLDLAWVPDTRTLTGKATIQLRAVTAVPAIALDFSSAYTLDSVTLNGAASRGSVEGHKLTVPAALKADQACTLVVAYHGKPTTVPMPSHRGDAEPLGLTVADDGGLWTMQEPYGSSTWYPSNDMPSDKALYDIAVTTPPGWSAVASGTPKGQEGTTFRYTSTDPVSSYLTTLAVDRYKQETATGPHGLPLTYWYIPGRDDAVMEIIRRSPQYLSWLEQRFGPYPFPSAGAVIVPSRSAMETQQMITIGANASKKDRESLESLGEDVLHEYAHHWFGDTVTTAQWKDLWLNEGLTTYVQLMFSLERDGVSNADFERWAREQDATMRRKLGPPGSPKADSFAEGNVYLCPAFMMHAVRRQIGDEAFLGLMRDWAQQHRNTTQDRATFTAFVNQRTGRDLTSLIDAWLDSPTTPSWG